jgi:predicted transcriptional regulator of viral defense system
MKVENSRKSILTKTQADILNEVTLRYGDIITFDQIVEVFGETYSRDYLKQVVSRLVKNGWLVRLRKGEYFVTDLSNLGHTSLSVYFLANYFVRDSFVSFAQALQYHGMHDQLLSTVVSLSLSQHPPVQMAGVTYRYVKTQPRYFFGYEEVRVDGRMVRIATAEKALIDMIQFHRTDGAIALVVEKLSDYRDELDLNRLAAYLARSNRITRKIFGELLRQAGFEQEALQVRKMAGQDVLLPGSDQTRMAA